MSFDKNFFGNLHDLIIAQKHLYFVDLKLVTLDSYLLAYCMAFQQSQSTKAVLKHGKHWDEKIKSIFYLGLVHSYYLYVCVHNSNSTK